MLIPTRRKTLLAIAATTSVVLALAEGSIRLEQEERILQRGGGQQGHHHGDDYRRRKTSLTSSCQDSTVRFKLNWKGKQITRDCRWVSNKQSTMRCNVSGVSEVCAETCNTCSECVDSSVRFRLEWRLKQIVRDCKWVKNKATLQKCKVDGVSDACRSTCKACSGGEPQSFYPSPSQTPSQSTTKEGSTNNFVRELADHSSSSSSHMCAIVNNSGDYNDWKGNELFCWGDNYYGQIGDGTVLDYESHNIRSTPTKVNFSDSDVAPVKVALGGAYTCAITQSKSNNELSLWCWGNRSSIGDVLDDGRFYESISTPTKVELPEEPDSISLGDGHLCVITSVKKLYCWGSNFLGKVGADPSSYPTISGLSKPTLVSGLSDRSVLQVYAGLVSTCAAVLAAPHRKVYCWGWLSYEKLFQYPDYEGGVYVPTPIDSYFRGDWDNWKLVTMTLGAFFHCAIVETIPLHFLKTYCWGSNDLGQLGIGSIWFGTTAAEVATDDAQLVNLEESEIPIAISSGGAHTCAITMDSKEKLMCWGRNYFGEVGNGSEEYSIPTPSIINIYDPSTGLDQIPSSVVVGSKFSCALTKNQQVFCWGRNNSGQLGVGSTESKLLSPTLVQFE